MTEAEVLTDLYINFLNRREVVRVNGRHVMVREDNGKWVNAIGMSLAVARFLHKYAVERL